MSKSFLESDREQWHLECWAWIIRHTKDRVPIKTTQLITPTKNFFEGTSALGEERAEHIFNIVKRPFGLDATPIELLAQSRTLDRISEYTYLVPNSPLALGTYQAFGSHAVVTYDPDLLGDPIDLVATFAHELSHHCNYWFAISVPEGDELYEPATDLTTVYYGYGLFGLLSRSLRSRTSRDGESYAWYGGGYFTDEEWIYALAVYLVLTATPIQTCEQFLTDRQTKLLKVAIKRVTEAQQIKIIEQLSYGLY